MTELRPRRSREHRRVLHVRGALRLLSRPWRIAWRSSATMAPPCAFHPAPRPTNSRGSWRTCPDADPTRLRYAFASLAAPPTCGSRSTVSPRVGGVSYLTHCESSSARSSLCTATPRLGCRSLPAQTAEPTSRRSSDAALAERSSKLATDFYDCGPLISKPR